MGFILSDVAPTKPLAPWQGGKNRLAKKLVAQINEISHETYAEPFVGMGGVFFKRSRRPKSEVINDFSGDVANLFRILNKHYAPFIDMMRYQLSGREEFTRLLSQDPNTLTDLERAARFLYLQRLAFGGKVMGRTFGVAADRPARFNIATLEPLLLDVHDRLAGVVIEQLDWCEFIKRYDRAGTLFYLDPPYWGTEKVYGDFFDQGQYEKMSALLANIKGKFILSINDHAEVRRIFAGFNQESVDVSYSVGGGKSIVHGKRFGELIITG